MKFTAAIRQAYRAHNFAVMRAREEYAAHPIAAFEEDWCEACDYPREERRCTVCRAHMEMRKNRGAS